MEGIKGSAQGRGCLCGCDFIILNSQYKKLGWNLAHELGHVMWAKIKCWKWNLMIEYSPECSMTLFQGWSHDLIKFFSPKFLNQEQIDNVKVSIQRFI